MSTLSEDSSSNDRGIVKRLIGVFFSPGATFATLRFDVKVSDWLVPLILVGVVSVISMHFAGPIVQEMSMAQMKANFEQNEQMSEAQREKAIANMDKMQNIGRVATLVGAPIGIAAMLFVTSFILLLLVRVVLGGEATYKQVLAVNSYSALITIPASIVTVPLMLIKESAYVQIGFGLLLPDSMAHTFLARLLFNLNFFSIWQYALVAIGLGIVAGVSTKKATIGVFVLFLIYAVGAAALQGLAGGVGG